MEKLPRVAPIREETKYMIKRKSAYTLPNNPSREGMKPADIKRAFWGPVVDTANSLVAELERVITEINAFIQSTESEIGGAEGIVTKAEEIRKDIVALAGRAATAAEHAAVAREKSESAAVESLYYSELSRKAMENQEGSRAFVVDTMEELLIFARTGQARLYRIVDGERVPYSPKDLETGDTIYVKALDVPDFWWIKTDTAEGAFVYEGETLAYPMAESHTIAERMAEIDAVIAEQSAALQTGETVVNTDGDALVPDYDWYLYGVGSEEEPYRIGSPAALLALSNLSNGLYDPAVLGEDEATIHYFDGKYFMQTANIDMGGITLTPIAWAEMPDRNTRNYSRIYYDGRGHSISNFKQSGLKIGGLFGYIGSYTPEENKPNCYIKNLTLSNANISATNTAGAVVAVIRPGVDIVNCHTTDSVSVEISNVHNSEIGGLIGYINEWNDDEAYVGQRSTRVAYCTNRAQITGSANVGGVVGYIQSAPKTIIEYCINYGSLIGKGNETDTVFIGGILGRQQGRSEVALVDTCVRYCANAGIEQGIGNAKTRCGGIIGHAYGYNSHYGADYGYPTYVLEYCYDTGSKIYDNVGTLTRYSLIANCTGKEALKQYKYCHGVAPVDGLTYHASSDFYRIESCSVVDNVEDSFVDAFSNVICQLQPLESATAEMQKKIDAMEERMAAVELYLWPPLEEFYCDGLTFYFVENMTWADFVKSKYNTDDKFAINTGDVLYAESPGNYNRWLDVTGTDKIIADQEYRLM